MKRLAILMVACLIPACATSTNTDWNPNFMHWSDPNKPAVHPHSSTVTEGAIDDSMLGEASETEMLQESDVVDQTDTEAVTEAEEFGE